MYILEYSYHLDIMLIQAIYILIILNHDKIETKSGTFDRRRSSKI